MEPVDLSAEPPDILQQRALKAEHLRQQVLELQHRLEVESHRFEVMQRFVRRGMLCDSAEQLGKLICLSLVEILDCSAGLFWCLRCEQVPGCEKAAGIELMQSSSWHILKDWVHRWAVDHAGGLVDQTPAVLPPLPASLGFRSACLASVVTDSVGRSLGVLLAVNLAGTEDCHDELGPAAAKVFNAFCEQTGALVESLGRRRMIEEQMEVIRTSECRLSSALAGSRVGLWEVDLATGRTYYSEEWKQQLGYSGDEIREANDEWFERVHPDDLERVLKEISRLRKSCGRSFRSTYRLRHKNGSWRWITSTGFNITDANSDGSGRIIGTHIDVTEFKKLEDRLLKARKTEYLARIQAERENRAKSSFLAAVSHEIRTPLNGIVAAFEMLRLDQPESQRQRLIELGQQSCQWMLKIIGESLDISRIEAGKLEISPEPVDLAALLDNLCQLKRPRALAKGIEFHCEISSRLPRFIMVDPVRLKQILSNLLGNAIKFTSQGGIHFSVLVSKNLKPGGARLTFKVVDTGVGIDREFKKILFKPFTQASSRRGSAEHGIGLGLAITRELVRMMKGRIRVRSTPRCGTDVTVILPVREADSARPEQCTQSDEGLPVFGGKVLLAEDDPVSGEMGKIMMERLGFVVDVARDGMEALVKAAACPYDLIFMDCWMPGKGGIQATEELRADPRSANRKTPVIALTANARQSDEEACRNVGMNGFLTKPLNLQSLIAMIDHSGIPRVC